jgi:hypothetical protein
MGTTTLSLIAFCVMGITGHVSGVSEYEGVLVFETKGNFGVSIGGFIAGPRSEWAHEYAHYLQAQELGVAYLPMVALPGAVRALRLKTGAIDYGDYFNVWWEREAQEYALANDPTYRDFNSNSSAGFSRP